MGLLPDTQNCGCACAGNAGNVFPVAAGKRSRHASRHVRYARAVMHAGIAKKQFPSKSAAGENVPGIPGACATCHFAYLVRGPCQPKLKWINIEQDLPQCPYMCEMQHLPQYINSLMQDYTKIARTLGSTLIQHSDWCLILRVFAFLWWYLRC